MAKMKSGAPAQKVTFAAAAAAFATVIVSVFGDAVPGLNLKQFQAEFVTVITFLAGYMMPPAATDAIMPSSAIEQIDSVTKQTEIA